MKIGLVLGLIGLLAFCSGGVWAQNNPPVAILFIDPNPGLVDQTIQFDGTASYDPDQQQGDYIVSYEWDFDYDDMTFEVDATGPTPTHSYSAQVSDGLVALRVQDTWGATHVTTDTINIYEAAQCDQDGDTYVSDSCGGDDCDDSNGNVFPTNANTYCDCEEPYPQGTEESVAADNCIDGLDNDCDGSIDYDDPDCGAPYGPGPANIGAAYGGESSLGVSDLTNQLILLLIPGGTVVFLRIVRRKN